METVKVYLDEARNACIVCGNCGKAKEIDFSKREIPRSGHVKCGCGHTFAVTFEKRQHYRKRVAITGACFVHAGSLDGEPISIVDISLAGLQLEILGLNHFQVHQKLRIVFRLEGKTVNLVVSVCHIKDKTIGAEILSMDEHSRKVLGFYLLP